MWGSRAFCPLRQGAPHRQTLGVGAAAGADIHRKTLETFTNPPPLAGALPHSALHSPHTLVLSPSWHPQGTQLCIPEPLVGL